MDQSKGSHPLVIGKENKEEIKKNTTSYFLPIKKTRNLRKRLERKINSHYIETHI